MKRIFKRKKVNQGKQEGFTLVEVLVATLILVVAVLPIMTTFLYAQKMNVKGRQKEQAMVVAQNTVETIKALGAYVAYGFAEDEKTGIMSSADEWKAGTKVTSDKTKNLSDGTTVTYEYLKYDMTITPIMMGKTNYTAKVKVELDDSNEVNVKAYSYKSAFDEASLTIMKYYKITAEVSLEGSTDILATYSGTVVTKN